MAVMTSFARLLGVVVVLCCFCLDTQHVGVAGETFNFEVARRVKDRVKSFLATTHFPMTQLMDTVNLGFVNTSSPTLYTELRQSMFALLKSIPEVGALFVQLVVPEQIILALFRSENIMLTSENVQVANCVRAPEGDEYCLSVVLLTDAGNPWLNAGSRVINATARGLVPTTGDPTWSQITQLTLTEIGTARNAPIYRDQNGTSELLGFVAAGVLTNYLDDFLRESFGGEDDQRVVYIMETNGKMIAASVPNITTVVGTKINKLDQADALTCGNNLVMESSAFLLQGNNREDVVQVYKNFYIQSTPYKESGLDWDIVVVRPAETATDYISTSSTTFFVLTVVTCLSIATSLSLALWVLKFHRLRIWKAAQPHALLLVLLANIACASCTFVFVGAPSKLLCLGRQWLVTLSLTAACGSLLAKLVRVHAATNTSNLVQRGWLFKHITKPRHLVIFVSTVVCIQIGVLVSWTVASPLTEDIEYQMRLGVLVGVSVCTTDGTNYFIACASLVWVLVACCCVMSFLTRNLSETFAESRALFMVCFHGTFIGVILMSVAMLADVSFKSLNLFIVVSLLWFTTTTQIALFSPRIYRQVTLGDWSEWEMRQMLVQHLNKSVQLDSTPVVMFGGESGRPSRRVELAGCTTPATTDEAHQMTFVI